MTHNPYEAVLHTTLFVTFLNLIFVLYWAAEECRGSKRIDARVWCLMVMAAFTFVVPVVTLVLGTQGG